MRIDAHQHFWKYDPQKHGWINDEMAAIRKDFFPEDLIGELSNAGIDGTIAVQAVETEHENEFLLSLAENHEFIKGVVGWADLRSPLAEQQVARLSANKKLVGFRCVMQGKEDSEYLTHPLFAEQVRMLNRYDKTYDLLVYHDQLASLIRFTDQLPDNKLMLDHIAKPNIKEQDIKTWAAHMEILSRNPNIYCKMSGMITEADYRHWTYEDILPYMEIALTHFGVDRVCFGSDWPVCLVAGTYSQVFGVVNAFISRLSTTEKEKILGLNATQFYKI